MVSRPVPFPAVINYQKGDGSGYARLPHRHKDSNTSCTDPPLSGSQARLGINRLDNAARCLAIHVCVLESSHAHQFTPLMLAPQDISIDSHIAPAFMAVQLRQSKTDVLESPSFLTSSAVPSAWLQPFLSIRQPTPLLLSLGPYPLPLSCFIMF